MKVLVFGPQGYLGQQFLRLYPEAVPSEADIADRAAVSQDLDSIQPDVVINAAGKTGKPNVDWCEDHKLETVMSNVAGPLILLDECAKRGIYWVQLGSGCIYEGDNQGRGFTEDDAPNFSASFYSRTKSWADQMLKDFPVLTLRLRMPFDDTEHQRSLITKLKKYPRVLDVQNSLTYLPDFLSAAKILIEKRKTGIYNVVNPGTISAFEIMKMYKEIVQPLHQFEALNLKSLSQVVKAGRSNCILSTKKLEGEGIRMRHVADAVKEALTQIARKG